MSKNVFFSIVIPTHNRPALLSRALESIKVQPFEWYEVIVVDDGSFQSYDDVLNRHGSWLDRYIKIDSSGVSAARNVGMREAKGEWIVFLDDDDEFSPDYFCDLYNKIQSFGTESYNYFFWSNVKVLKYNGDASEIDVVCSDYDNEKIFGSDTSTKASTIGCSYGLTVNRNIIRDSIFFDSSFLQAEDTEFVIKLLKGKYVPSYLSVIGVIKHDHSGVRLTQSFSEYSKNRVYERIFSMHEHYFISHKSVYASMLYWCSLVHYINNDFNAGDVALKTFIKVGISEWINFPKFLNALSTRRRSRRAFRLEGSNHLPEKTEGG